jgi:hypothetical protein
MTIKGLILSRIMLRGKRIKLPYQESASYRLRAISLEVLACAIGGTGNLFCKKQNQEVFQ